MKTIADTVVNQIVTAYEARCQATAHGAMYVNHGAIEIYYFYADSSAIVIIADSVVVAGKGTHL